MTIYNANLMGRHLAGEDISTWGIEELKKLECQLKAGVERIRSKKVINNVNLLHILYYACMIYYLMNCR